MTKQEEIKGLNKGGVKKMVKKDKKEISMELEYFEQNELSEIEDLRNALTELQRAVLPFAKGIARKQRVWWDGVLEVRGLTREGTCYTITNGRTIVDELTNKGDEK